MYMMRSFRGMIAATGLAAAFAFPAHAEDTIKIGVLHSLSGTMAISETDAQGHGPDDGRRHQQEGRPARQEGRGGGRRSGLGLAALRRKGARAPGEGQVAVVFGCWTSVSRKSVLPVFEELNGLLFYPVQYEGEESSQQRLLHRRRAEPAGDPGGRISDEQGRRRGEALGARRHRLRLSAHHQQDPRGLPASPRASPPRTS